ncbi:helix-turn-helix transcriptional regulator [Antrihabitans stalactiti]|uniref:AraC family transcriptional regulator n=1 Tax=Antrihabitans stalactiti TaxID=2584121 RepID=A0A848K5X9_9NOCA|nr:AraC family transcriptional regulator [Antrihabitans stalactiti]NMN93971.1 AraC family transcriptional regulator [Antrihabitans stalactiti]
MTAVIRGLEARKEVSLYTVETLHSDQHRRHERGDWWRDQVSSIHCPMTFDLANNYRGKLEHQRSDTYQLVRWWGDSEVISRGNSDIRRHPHDAYELLVPVRGELALRQGDRESTLTPTVMALTSLDSALDLSHGDGFSSVAFVMPRARVDARMPVLPPLGTILDASSGLGCIVVDLVMSLRRQRHELTGAQFDIIADRVVDLLALAYNADTASRSVAVQEGLVSAIRRVVRENAHDPDLTGAGVAKRLGWSLRHVQAQLQRAGTTPSELIREERLALARLRLQDRGWSHQSVTQVAYSSGFQDLSTFSNTYRRAFGERPSDTRSAAAAD